MIELILGSLVCYVCNVLEKERKVLKRVKNANKKLFTDDRPKYINV